MNDGLDFVAITESDTVKRFLKIFTHSTILFLNRGESTVKDSYSPPSPQT